jgi:glycyl-tRNA synthetase beta chain
VSKKKAAKAPGAASLLVEILTEELPPKSLLRFAEVFRDALASGLNGSSLVSFPYSARCFASPRRLAVLIHNVANKATDMHSDTSGPSVAAGIKAAEGFAKKYGVTVDALKRVSTAKGEVYVASYTTKGAQLDEVLSQKVEAALKALPVSKVMRWGEGEAQFVRPVHGLVMMHGKRAVPGNVLGVPAGNTTSGHRFMGAASIRLSNADEYEAKLREEGHVVADFAVRKSEIDRQLQAEAKRQKASLGEYQELLDEVTALVEFPVVYAGAFDASFLEVPQECLILTMRQNQKYFPLFASDGKLLPKFLIVSNMRVDDPRHIVGGNERVVRPRLEDARFFFNQDRKVRLEARVPQLAKVVYHGKLGSQLERTQRIKLLTGEIARSLRSDVMLAERAAELSKADLLTGMVGEFPELQGTMGRYYALHDGEPGEVADAIEAHYRPRYAGDRLPEGKVACALALADKLYALVGIFASGGAPTGEKDPFALRRQALGVLRILMETPIPLDLFQILRSAEEVFPKDLIKNNPNEVRDFMLDRLRNYLRERGEDTLQVEAVVSQINGLIHQAPARLRAVKEFLKLPEAKDLAAANKRVLNIIYKNEEIRNRFVNPSRTIMKERAEIALMDAVERLAPVAKKHFESGEYEESLRLLAKIKPDVDRFFDEVMVMVEDTEVRNNRAALLQQLGLLMNQVADISKLAA